MPDEVRAAGGFIVRDSRVLLVHRPKYDDWSLPKGKLDEGEEWEAAALREVCEETGLRCELGEELPSVHYRDAKERPKRVRYWRMTNCRGEFSPTDEVDDVRWAARDEALEMLSYSHDRDLVARAL
jgi:8-oxo-dGTP diphosphatase